MVLYRKSLVFPLLLILTCLVGFGFGQAKQGDGSVVQRLDVMRQKLDTMQRSLNGAIAGLKEENKDDKPKKGEKENLDTPLGRLRALLKDTSNLLSDVIKVRGKVDRAEKYDRTEVDSLE